jgi:hypothetical protein
MSSEKEVQAHSVVVAYRIEPELQAWTDAQAGAEGISRADFARRALIREKQRQQKEGAP